MIPRSLKIGLIFEGIVLSAASGVVIAAAQLAGSTWEHTGLLVVIVDSVLAAIIAIATVFNLIDDNDL